MDLVVAEIFTALLVFAVLVGCSFLSFSLISCRNRKNSSSAAPVLPVTQNAKSKWSDTVPLLSLCNCFAAGVFLATCFLGLVPHVRLHVAMYEEMKQNNDHHYNIDGANVNYANTSQSASFVHRMNNTKVIPWTELLLIGGFLLILLLEEFVRLGQSCRLSSKKRTVRAKKLDVKQAIDKSNGDKSKKNNHHHHHHYEDQPLITAGECQDELEDGDKMHLHDISPERHQHGHSHHDASMILADGSSLDWRSIVLLLGLGIHGAFEGVALGLQETSEALFSLLFGVMTHEVLCAVAFGINLAGHKIRFSIGFLTVVLFSLSIPLGMVGGFVVRLRQTTTASSIMVRIVLEGLAAGTFVYVAFVDMLNHELATDKCRFPKVLCICFGFLLFFGLTLFT